MTTSEFWLAFRDMSAAEIHQAEGEYRGDGRKQEDSTVHRGYQEEFRNRPSPALPIETPHGQDEIEPDHAKHGEKHQSSIQELSQGDGDQKGCEHEAVNVQRKNQMIDKEEFLSLP